MPKKRNKNMLGAWAFLIGVIIAVIFAFLAYQTWVGWVLVLIGIAVGLLNIADIEVQPFLLAGVVLVIVSYFGSGVFTGLLYLGEVLDNLLMLFVPATIIVALKSVFTLARR